MIISAAGATTLYAKNAHSTAAANPISPCAGSLCRHASTPAAIPARLAEKAA